MSDVLSVFMCVNYPKFNNSIGISKKIDTQIKTFEKMGYDVTFSAYGDKGIEIYHEDKPIVSTLYPSVMPSTLKSALKRFFLMNTCSDYLEKNDCKYTLGYIRWTAIDSKFLKVLRRLKEKCKYVVIDCHGYFPSMKGVGIKGKYTDFFTKLNQAKVKKYANLALTETKAKTVFGIKSMTVDTGIDVDRYMEHQYIGPRNEVHMISVSNETPYHGLDRVVNGLADYYNSKHSVGVYLHLVGNITEKTKDLIRKKKMEDRVILYGYQSGDELQRIYNQTNIGIGPLSPSRIGGKEGTGIKTKEYFAIGLPYFYGGAELLVDETYKYIHRIPDDESPIDIMEIIQFYNDIKNDMDMVFNMRKYARDHFNWELIYKKMFEELEFEG